MASLHADREKLRSRRDFVTLHWSDRHIVSLSEVDI